LCTPSGMNNYAFVSYGLWNSLEESSLGGFIWATPLWTKDTRMVDGGGNYEIRVDMGGTPLGGIKQDGQKIAQRYGWDSAVISDFAGDQEDNSGQDDKDHEYYCDGPPIHKSSYYAEDH
jgi:hypothetical protein